jgi:hypothetical protein
MPDRKCPLCNQPVTEKLFERITGIWKAKEEQEKELALKKKAFLAQQKAMTKKLQEDRRQMKADQKKQVEVQVQAATKKFEAKMKGFDEEKKRIKASADKKILAAVAQAKSQAKAQYQAQMKEQLEKSVAAQVKKSTAKMVADNKKMAVDKKKSEQTLASTRKQMSTLQANSTQQQAKIKSLERQLKNKTTPQLEGLLYEETLTDALQKEFPSDKLQHTGKGGDILHDVIHQKEPSGVIVYECKKVAHWNGDHLEQTVKAQLSRKADFGILVTNASKRNSHGFFIEKGVIVVNPGGVLAIASILREQLVKMAQLKLSKAEREEAIGSTLKYLQGPEFKNSLNTIIQKAVELNEDLKDEYEDHMKTWKKRQDSLKIVYVNAVKVKGTTLALMAGKKPSEQVEVEAKPFPLLPELTEEKK